MLFSSRRMLKKRDRDGHACVPPAGFRILTEKEVDEEARTDSTIGKRRASTKVQRRVLEAEEVRLSWEEGKGGGGAGAGRCSATTGEPDEADTADLAAKLNALNDRVQKERAVMVRQHEQELQEMDEQHAKDRADVQQWMMQVRARCHEHGMHTLEFHIAQYRDQMNRIPKENAVATGKARREYILRAMLVSNTPVSAARLACMQHPVHWRDAQIAAGAAADAEGARASWVNNHHQDQGQQV